MRQQEPSDLVDLPGEVWKPDILTGMSFVMASSCGRIKVGERRVQGGRNRIKQYILKPYHAGGDGHLCVCIRWDGHGKIHRVSRIVCAAFNGPPPEDRPFACHNNGDLTDNRPENLRWGSSLENAADKKLHGTQPIGEGHHRAKIRHYVANAPRRGRTSPPVVASTPVPETGRD